MKIDPTTAQNIRYYDSEASVYDENRYTSTQGRRVDIFQKRILSEYLAELVDGAKVLEFGCGTGRLLSYFNAKRYRLTGIDISKEMLERARRRIEAEADASVTLALTDPYSIPFVDGSFDAVYAILVINLLTDYEASIAEIARVLRRGGFFVFNVPNLSSVFFPIGLYVNIRGKSRRSNCSGYRYSHWFSRSELYETLTRQGFEVEEIQGQPLAVRYRDAVSPLKSRINSWLLAKSVYIKARRR